MKVSGEYRPPVMGYEHESFPVTGAGDLEVTPTTLRLEGSRGFPIEATVLGLGGLVLGMVVAFLIAANAGETAEPKGAMLAVILGGLFGGSSLGYAASRWRKRKRSVTEVPVAKVVAVDVDAAKRSLQITVGIRRRWQNRKQIIFFSPTDPSELAPLADAVRAARS
jgi:hypothetical protein